MGSNSVVPGSVVPGSKDAGAQTLEGLGKWLSEKPRSRTIVLRAAVGTLIEAEAFEDKREVAQTAGHRLPHALINLVVKLSW